MIDSTIVCFDFETGGLDPCQPEIQLAAIAVDSGFREIDAFERKIQFSVAACNPEALAKNNFDEAVWKREAVPVVLVIQEFGAFLKAHATMPMVSKAGNAYRVARLAGHNIVSFDLPRLQRMFKYLALGGNAFLPAHPQGLDTLQLALWAFQGREVRPDNYQLSTLCAFLNIEVKQAHDALADVRMCAAVAQAIYRDLRWEVAA